MRVCRHGIHRRSCSQCTAWETERESLMQERIAAHQALRANIERLRCLEARALELQAELRELASERARRDNGWITTKQKLGMERNCALKAYKSWLGTVYVPTKTGGPPQTPDV